MIKVCYDQSYDDIGVVTALADVFLGTRSRQLFPPIATSMLEQFRFLRALSKG